MCLKVNWLAGLHIVLMFCFILYSDMLLICASLICFPNIQMQTLRNRILDLWNCWIYVLITYFYIQTEDWSKK